MAKLIVGGLLLSVLSGCVSQSGRCGSQLENSPCLEQIESNSFCCYYFQEDVSERYVEDIYSYLWGYLSLAAGNSECFLSHGFCTSENNREWPSYCFQPQISMGLQYFNQGCSVVWRLHCRRSASKLLLWLISFCSFQEAGQGPEFLTVYWLRTILSLLSLCPFLQNRL